MKKLSFYIALFLAATSFGVAQANIIVTNTQKNNTYTNANASQVDYSIWETLLEKHVSDAGLVSYKGFQKDSVEFDKFLNQLSNTKITESWTKKDKISYWINVYNAYTIKLILNNYPVKSIKDISKPWGKKFFKINGELMNLTEVEHEILRKFKEPRIHFAINCASASCPKILNKVFTPKNLEQLLEKQTNEFVNNEFHNKINSSEVRLSKIFDWYEKDFKETDGSLKNFINRYSKVKINDQKINYKKYDWSLNSAK